MTYNLLDILQHAGVEGLQNKNKMPGNAGTARSSRTECWFHEWCATDAGHPRFWGGYSIVRWVSSLGPWCFPMRGKHSCRFAWRPCT